MSKYIIGESREQLVLFPDRLDSMIPLDSEVRVIDAFVEGLDMIKLGFENPNRKKVGAPGYNPKDMLKLYLYGYVNKVRSSRKLMRLTKMNTEVMWLIRKLEPDFRCISDFRKENVENLKKVFFEFNIICKEAGVLSIEKTSQDGTKIRAVNAKDKNFTLNKLDDRIERIKEEIESILEDLAKTEEEPIEKLIRLEELKKRRKQYEMYEKEMESKKINQKSLTDPEAKLMKNNGAFEVCYNNQVQVDCKNHMITNYEVTAEPADFGTMSSIVEESEKVYGSKVEINITDNGYADRKDMMKLLENGTRPEVTPARGKDSYILETKYEENEITEEELKSEKVEDIKKCLRAGKIPKKYEKSIEEISIKETRRLIAEKEIEEKEIRELSEEELRDRAIEKNIFIRDKEKEKVYCPGGAILRAKARYEDGTIKFCNKLGCQNCKNPCTMAQFKEVKFKKNQVVVNPKEKNGKSKKRKDISNFYSDLKNIEIKISEDMEVEEILKNIIDKIGDTSKKEEKKNLSTKKGDKKWIKEKVVLIKYKVDKNELKDRMSTSEHCHGTMKRNDDASYFLLKGLKKVNGEMGLYYTASNIRRAVNLLGATKIIKYIKEYNQKSFSAINEIKNNIKSFIEMMVIYLQSSVIVR